MLVATLSDASLSPPPQITELPPGQILTGRRRSCILPIFVAALIILCTSTLAARAVPGTVEFAHAQVAFRAHKYATAAHDYQIAITHGYQDAGAFYQLGLCFTYQRRWSSALWAYDRALEIEPHFGDAHPELNRRRYQALDQGGRDHPPPILAHGRLVILASSDDPRRAEPLGGQSIAPTPIPSMQRLPFWLVPVFSLGCAVATLAVCLVALRRRLTRPASPPLVQHEPTPSAATVTDSSGDTVAAPPTWDASQAVAAAVLHPSTKMFVAEAVTVVDAAPQTEEIGIASLSAEHVSVEAGMWAAIITPQTTPTPTSSPLDPSMMLARSTRILLRCPSQLPRRPSVTFLDELRHARAILSSAPSAAQFIRRLLLWPGLLLPRLASIDELGVELLRTYYAIGLIERIRRPNSKVVKDIMPPRLSDVAVCTYCGVQLCLRLAGTGEMLAEFASGALRKEQTFVGFCPPVEHAKPWGTDEVQRRLRLLGDLGLVELVGVGYRATPLLQALTRHPHGMHQFLSAQSHALLLADPGRPPTRPGAATGALPSYAPALASAAAPAVDLPDEIEIILDLLLKPERHQAGHE